MQQGHHLHDHAARARLDSRVRHQAAVQLDDLRPQAPDTVEVGVAGAEVVERDQAAARAQQLDGGGEVGVVLHRLLEHLEHHLRPGQAEVRQELLQEAVVMVLRRAQEDLGVHVEEQPLRRGRDAGVVGRVQGAHHAVAPAQRLEGVDAEEARRRHRGAVGVGRAQQRLVTDHPAVREAEDRLEVAVQPQAVEPADHRRGARALQAGEHGRQAGQDGARGGRRDHGRRVRDTADGLRLRRISAVAKPS